MTTFMKMNPDGTTSNVREIKQGDLLRCPHFIMVAEHYRDDGSCKCDDHAEQAMMIKEWGYKQSDLPPVVDVKVACDGSIYRFALRSQRALDWVEENVDMEHSTMWGNNELIVDHRYAGDLTQGMQRDGLEVK